MSTEELLKISQDMARVLDRLTAPGASIDPVRKHGVKEFHGTSLEGLIKLSFGLRNCKELWTRLNVPLDR